MKLTILSTILVAAGATLVSAAPGPSESTARVSYSENFARTSRIEATGWVDLASPTPAEHGREYIDVGASAGKFSRLRITAASGHPIVVAMRIEFVDGTHRVVALDSILAPTRKAPVIDLRGPHAIDHLVVVTDRDSRGTYTVQGVRAGSQEVATR